MRRATVISALVLTACGGSTPITPTAPTPFMPPGKYALALLISFNGSAGIQPPCTMSGDGDPNGTIPMPLTGFVATAESDGTGGLVIRPDPQFDLGLEMRLRASANGVVGTLRGAARDMAFPQQVIVDGGADGTAANLTGTFGFSRNDLGGPVSGRVRFERGGWLYSCPFNDWIMNRM